MVFKDVLNHRDTHNENEREGTEKCTVGLSDARNYLDKDTEKEVRIGNLGELNEQVLWQEVQASVLGCRHAIVTELAIMLSLLKDLIDLEQTAYFWTSVFCFRIRTSLALQRWHNLSWNRQAIWCTIFCYNICAHCNDSGPVFCLGSWRLQSYPV